MRALCAGIFVGGAGKRLGGRPKGLMRAPGGGTLVDRLHAVLTATGIRDVVLVGSHSAYADQPWPSIDDRPPSIGPLGGLASLLQYASEKDADALAVACDMPFVTQSLVARLATRDDAPILAPRRGGLWEPLCASYAPDRVLPVALRHVAGRDHSLQALLNAVGAVELPLDAAEAQALVDWDTPEDLAT